LFTGSTERLRIDSSGNVGIGTTTPTSGYKLNVGSTSSVTTLNGAAITLFTSGSLTSNVGGVLNFRPQLGTTISDIFNLSICAYDHSGDGNADGLSINGNDGVSFSTGGNSRNERMRIDSSGNLGIGTTTPVRKLTVSSAGSCEFVLQDTSQAANSRNWRLFNTSNTLYFGTLNDAGNSGTDVMKLTSGANLQFNSGYGSVATAYGCRAWCQYNQSPSIIGAGNFTSITVIGTGDVRLNFATAMVDANYSAVATTNESGGQPKWCNSTQPSTTDIRIVTFNANQSTGWFEYNSVAIFR